MSTGESNYNPIQAVASSVGGNRLRFAAKFAAASDKEGEKGDVRLFPPLEAFVPCASGG